MKSHGEDPIPKTIHAIFRYQERPSFSQNTNCVMQKRLVVCCVMKNIQQEDDIETPRVQRQCSAVEDLEWHIGLVGIDDIQAEHLTTHSVPKQLTQVTAPGTHIQHSRATGYQCFYRSKIEFCPSFFNARRFSLHLVGNDLSETHDLYPFFTVAGGVVRVIVQVRAAPPVSRWARVPQEKYAAVAVDAATCHSVRPTELPPPSSVSSRNFRNRAPLS